MIDSVFSIKFWHVCLQSLELSAVQMFFFMGVGGGGGREMPGIVFGRKSTGQYFPSK